MISRVWQTSMRLVVNYLHRDPGLPEVKTLWPYEPDEKSSRVNTEQHSRGERTPYGSRSGSFLLTSRGSLLQLETQILIAEQLKYISRAQTTCLVQLSAEVGRMLNALIESIRPKHGTSAE